MECNITVLQTVIVVLACLLVGPAFGLLAGMIEVPPWRA